MHSLLMWKQFGFLVLYFTLLYTSAHALLTEVETVWFTCALLYSTPQSLLSLLKGKQFGLPVLYFTIHFNPSPPN